MHTTQNIQKIPQAKTIKPLMTFIVTTYNIPSKMLHECISSILALSLSKEQREIIVVDDGSDEIAIKHIQDYADEITYIRQRNQGVSVARNLGLRCATGIFIQFVDGDDFLLQTQYEHCLDIIRYHQPADIVLFGLTDNAKAQMATDYQGPTTGAEYMSSNNLHGSVCGYIFKKSILQGLCFESDIVFGEDELFTPQLILNASNLYTTSAEAYFYRKWKGSITHKKSKAQTEKKIKDNIEVLLRLQSLKQNIDSEEKKQALARRIAQLTMDFLYNVIILTKSPSKIRKAKALLKENNLYPLPDESYTLKYKLFRKLI